MIDRLAERALAAGIQNMLFADIRTVEDTEEVVHAVRSEPKGLHGFRMDRRVGNVSCIASASDVVKMCDDAVIAIMVEKKSAVENLEEILSVEGLDMVQFGPSDYSLIIGTDVRILYDWWKKNETELKNLLSNV